MGKIDLKKQRKKEALLQSAYELFTTKGFQKTSILEIALHAGVAKGTFYLYYADKYSLRDDLIVHQSNLIFSQAMDALRRQQIPLFADRIIFIANYIIDYLASDKKLVRFISKNLSWALFKSALTTPSPNAEIDFRKVYYEIIRDSGLTFQDPEIMLFMIVELIGSTCNNTILNEEPVSIETFKPYLFAAIKAMIKAQIVSSAE
ncbi:MAG: TetR/AcrR family transcriptional regulator [Christensenella sp.]|nr:TetR/AcrR family transcriptional regulator [Christensenella sp.]